MSELERVGAVLQGGRVWPDVSTLEPPEPEPRPDGECVQCRDVGWCRADVMPGHPDFGVPKRCPVCGPKREAERVAALTAKLWEHDADAWTHYRDATLDTYPWSVQTLPLRPSLEAWLADDPSWLLLWGEPRRGKTGLSVALIRQLVERGNPGLLVTVPRLLERLRATYDRESDDSESDVLTTLIETPVLLMDDLGVERTSDWVTEKLYTIINGRLLGHRRTIITTNLEPLELVEKLGQRIGWRVFEMCRGYSLQVAGPNLSALGMPSATR